MNKINILGVKVDEVSLQQSVEEVERWLKNPPAGSDPIGAGGGKHYIVTPNIEFVMLAQEDKEFREILNKANLSIPDSSRFNWALKELLDPNVFKRIIYWPLFLTPSVEILPKFPVTTGVDLMEALIKRADEKGYTIGLLGGRENLAERLAERLKLKYKNLRIVFTDSSIVVDRNGSVVRGPVGLYPHSMSSLDAAGTQRGSPSPATPSELSLPPMDLLFVAFGHGKQEKWIAKNLQRSNVKVMMGVGGSFDYLSGDVKRAPKAARQLGLEWLYRLITQPWRIKRFISLLKFIFLVLAYRKT